MRSWTALITGMGLLLGACDLGAPGNDTQPDAAAEMERSTKLRAYSMVMTDYFSMAGFNPEQDLRRYEGLNIPKADPKEKISLFPLGLEQFLKDLKAARAEAGQLQGLDAAADRAIPVLERLLARLRGLDSYYTTRGPLTDGFERGRREHPLLIADYQAAIAVWKPLRAAFQSARDQELARSAAFYQREGHQAEYYDVTLAQKATELARTIDTPEAAGDPKKAADADRIVGELLTLVQRSRAARAARKDSDSSMMDNRVPENVEEMIGAWRDLRRTRDADALDKMMQPYASVMQAISL